ncbi:TPA: archease [Candidatus Micrarchaeota archaeon]|nr:archease [Candidatus Micrarchaeota archaeon]
MEKFVFFEHTADVLFEAHGKTLEECVENCAQAMFTIMSKPRLLKKSKKAVVKQKSGNLEELVVFLLDQLITESDTRQVFWKDFKVKSFKHPKGVFSIEGVARGSDYTLKAAGTHVKAVTMHRAKVWKDEKGEWNARIVLDI